MNAQKATTAIDSGLVKPSRLLLSLFDTYLHWYIGRHFHALRVAHASRFPVASRPLVVCLNHASWWDPLTSIILSRRWIPAAGHYAPMEAAALKRYGFMRRLGLFPVESGTPHGAAQFLRAAREILADPHSILWITPEGRFTDVRTRPIRFRPGLAALLSRLDSCTIVPLAIEYTFWDERLPEILACCGEPIAITEGQRRTSAEWSGALTAAMTATQDELAALAVLRDPSGFDTLISGRAGVGAVYDVCKRLAFLLRGRQYHDDPLGLRVQRTREH